MLPKYDILIVEDDGSDEELTIRALARLEPPPTFRTAKDGVEAIRSIEEHGYPRVLLLDLKLPKVTGLELMEYVRRSHSEKDLPILVLTSSEAQKDIDRCREVGANGYIVKPIDFDEYMENVGSVVQYWLGDRSGPPPEASLFTP